MKATDKIQDPPPSRATFKDPQRLFRMSEHLLCKHEDLSSNPQHPLKLVIATYACDTSPGELTGGFQRSPTNKAK